MPVAGSATKFFERKLCHSLSIAMLIPSTHLPKMAEWSARIKKAAR
jgi:hypothetical protein